MSHINPASRNQTRPWEDFRRLRHIAAPLFRRDIAARYRGSLMGLAWAFVVPAMMLAIYTFVFGGVLRMRWPMTASSSASATLDFALILFIGLMVHSYATEVLTRAPAIIVGNQNLVKRVVFPLQILPLIPVSTALFQYFVSLTVFLGFQFAITGAVSPGVLWLPVVLAPFTLLLAGCAWLLAGAAVYFRDIAQLMGLAGTVLLFVSPVFYPVSRLPRSLWLVFQLNPLTFIIEQSRAVVFSAAAPDFAGLGAYTAAAAGLALLGRAAFERMRKGFSDVL